MTQKELYNLASSHRESSDVGQWEYFDVEEAYKEGFRKAIYLVLTNTHSGDIWGTDSRAVEAFISSLTDYKQ